MNGIQLILITGIIVLCLYFVFRLRSAFIDLLIVFAFTGLSIFFILMPAYTNIIAGILGVGRGADLLFYICILFFLFIVLKLFSKIRKLEQDITKLTREISIKEAIDLKERN